MTKLFSRTRAVTLSIILLGSALLVLLQPNILLADVPPGTSQGAAADAARWEALADFYTRKAAADAQRANDAMAARWQAMVEFYAAQRK
jgi:hypothetical protein